jgi:molecular chaperone GrpE
LSAHKDKHQGTDPHRVTEMPSPDRREPSGNEPYPSGPLEPLPDEYKKLVAEKEDLMNTLVRRQADFENYRKRVDKERHQDRYRAVESLIENLLPVLDTFERALAAPHDDAASAEYQKGIELTHRQLVDALTKQGLKRIESVGKEFDPHFHHAIENVETTDQPEGFVLAELQSGYLFHDRVLRPAMVRVATEPASRSAVETRGDN